MAYLNADEWRPRSLALTESPAGMLLHLDPPGTAGKYGPCGVELAGAPGANSRSRWLLELVDDEDQPVRVLIADEGDWDAEGDEE